MSSTNLPQKSNNQVSATSSLVVGVIIAQQPVELVQEHIANLLMRLSRLYQIKDWTEEHAVDMAEWIYETYKFEEIQVITRVLKNPPMISDSKDKSWRITPDTISLWMTKELERVADERERRHQENKKQGAEPLPTVDYESYKKRLAEGALEEPKRKKDDEYEKFRAQYLVNKEVNNPSKFD